MGNSFASLWGTNALPHRELPPFPVGKYLPPPKGMNFLINEIHSEETKELNKTYNYE